MRVCEVFGDAHTRLEKAKHPQKSNPKNLTNITLVILSGYQHVDCTGLSAFRVSRFMI